MNVLHYLFSISKFILSQFYTILFGRKLLQENIWLVGEKKTEARDNGYHFFRYLRLNHPEIKAVYAISKDSVDRKKVADLGEVVDYGSFKHCVYYISAKIRACSQVHGLIPFDDVIGLRHFCVYKRKNQKQINLKHGISKDFRPGSFNFRKVGFDLYIAGAKPEYDEIKKQFHYPDKNIALTGFCRFDSLHNLPKPKKIILIMPTFRAWLKTSDSSKVKATDEEMQKFKESAYYEAYQNLLTDQDLIDCAAKNGYKLMFYLHYTFQPYVGAFESVANDSVTICRRGEYDVQNLLIQSSMLITDYSSVFFDYGYMKKPMAFYQFDLEEYRNKHYKEGYFSYERDAFGPLVKTKEDLVEYIQHVINQNMNMDEMYKKRAENFFIPYDDKNCERVYQATLNLLEENDAQIK